MRRAQALVLHPWARVGLLVLCVLLGWLAVRNAADRLWSEDDPDRAMRIWPADGASLASAGLARVLASGAVDAASLELSDRALRLAPRSAIPLTLAGLAASARGDLDRAQALMEAARARDPRGVIARSWLLDHFMRSGDYAAGLDEISPVIHLRSGAEVPVMLVLAGLMDVPRGLAALRAKLGTDPDWRGGFFDGAASNGADPRALAALLTSIPPAHDPDAAAREQRAVLYAMVERGDVRAAQAAWRGFLPPPYRAARIVYDPGFAGWPGVPPFNWALSGDPATIRLDRVADTAGGHALALTPGGGEAALAEQYTIVVPGAHVFSADARRLGEEPIADSVSATIRCAHDASVLATLRFDEATPRFTRFATGLTVPAGCDAIRIQFGAAAGERIGASTLQISAVRLDP